MHTLSCEMTVPVPISDVFRIFENPYNLAGITPAWLHFQVTSTDVQMRRGAEITYRIGWMGVPFSWKTLITEYDPPHCFVDEQIKGPYALWRHTHEFRTVDGGTVVSDRVEYILPLGPLGEWGHRMIVARQLREIFTFRREALSKLLGAAPTAFAPPVIS